MILFKNIKLILPALLIVITLTSVAQTNVCDTDPAGEITVNSSCVTSTFNTNTNNDYWNGASGCGANDYDDKWVWFTATTNPTVITYNSNDDAILHLFEGSCSTGMSAVSCADNTSFGDEEISYPTTIGVVYHIRIQNYTDDTQINGTICVIEGSGGGGGSVVTASDCIDAVNICTDLSFEINPNGIGIDEIPALGSTGNPSYDPLNGGPQMPASWGPQNAGCLRDGEKESTWMVINISGGGDLEFTFGGNGAQTGFYDWILYPYDANSCTDIPNNTVAPVRCNWNDYPGGGTGLSDPSSLPAGGYSGNFQDPLTVSTGDQYIICFSNYSSVTTSVPLEFGGTASVSCTPLPVELNNFNVEKKLVNNIEVARLQWETMSEINNDYFTIERSNDGINFEEITTITGQGNSNTLHNYSFIDDAPLTGTSYYRLKQTDFDGEHTYSTIDAVHFEETNEIKIFPNPSNGQFKITGKGIQSIRIINNIGLVVYSGTIKVVDLSKQPKGIYILEVMANNNITRTKIIIK